MTDTPMTLDAALTRHEVVLSVLLDAQYTAMLAFHKKGLDSDRCLEDGELWPCSVRTTHAGGLPEATP